MIERIETDASYTKRKIRSALVSFAYSFFISAIIYTFITLILEFNQNILIMNIIFILLLPIMYYFLLKDDMPISRVKISNNLLTPSHKPLISWLLGKKFSLDFDEIKNISKNKWKEHLILIIRTNKNRKFYITYNVEEDIKNEVLEKWKIYSDNRIHSPETGPLDVEL